MRSKNGLPRWRLGPGLMVTAAFVGPGTVVTASKAGITAACSLLWVIVMAGIATVILQSFAASLGIRAKCGLSEYLRRSLAGSSFLWPMIILVVAAIGIGNAAYQTGNLLGAATGLSESLGGSTAVWVLVIAGVATALLLRGQIQFFRLGLGILVALMSFTFIAAAILAWPGLEKVAQGVLRPSFEESDFPLVLALVGTTIVPYNLFLHASTAASRWKHVDEPVALRQAFWDTTLSISLGILVTACIIISASIASDQTSGGATGLSVGSLSEQLRPLLGDYATVLFSLGLFAAGMTSSMTAPLATAYAVTGLIKATQSSDAAREHGIERDWQFRGIAIAVVLVGTAFAITYSKAPVQAILVAQIANGLLLPVVAAALMWAATRALIGGQQLQECGGLEEGAAAPIERRISTLGVIAVFAGWAVVVGVSLLSGYRLYGVFS